MTKEIPPVSATSPLAASKPISDITEPAPQVRQVNAPTQTPALPPGIQSALVLAEQGRDEATGGHLYLLQLSGKQTLTVSSNVPLTPGQVIAFQTNTSPMRLVATTESTANLVSRLISQLSTQQNSMVSSVALLQAVLTSPTLVSDLQRLAPEVAEAAERLYRQVPELADLTRADKLTKAVANSGVFLESKLAVSNKGPALDEVLETDLKALLGKLSVALESSPGLKQKLTEPAAVSVGKQLTPAPLTSEPTEALAEPLLPLLPRTSVYSRVAGTHPPPTGSPAILPQVPPPIPGAQTMHFHPHLPTKRLADMGDALFSLLFRSTQASLNRMTLQQLASAVSDEEPPSDEDSVNGLRFHFDLPFVFQNSTHAINIKIEREPDRGREPTEQKKQVNIWNVTLAFDLEFVGPMQIQLRINDKQASATIWAQREQTLQTTRGAVDELKASLTQIGLTVTAIDCKAGLPSHKGTPLEHRLVDIKT